MSYERDFLFPSKRLPNHHHHHPSLLYLFEAHFCFVCSANGCKLAFLSIDQTRQRQINAKEGFQFSFESNANQLINLAQYSILNLQSVADATQRPNGPTMVVFSFHISCARTLLGAGKAFLQSSLLTMVGY